jgi:unsaturated rhamnogalacturonyl hydrolase
MSSGKEVSSRDWAIKMAESDMVRNPESWMIDFSKRPNWGYCQGLVCSAHERVGRATGDAKYIAYVKEYADTMIDENGVIGNYKLTDYNIDKVRAGTILFSLYDKTGDKRYRIAIQTLRDQMKAHPRTSDGGFWHKKRYPHQMWLDGLYMASPFLVQYAHVYNEDGLFDDVANQIKLIHKHLRDPETGLYRHGWDESRKQKWADPNTGLSRNVWGRGMGWFAMAMIDVLDFFPKDHPERDNIIDIAHHMATMIKKYQEPKSGLWYQVVDQGAREGNYLEATVSTMFVYFLIKGINDNVLDQNYLPVARKGYDGLLNHLIRENEDGTISITQCCAGAGLGGKRDGTFAYYIHTQVRDDDPKAVGPFIMLALEFDRFEKTHKR